MTCNDKGDPYYERLNENLELLKPHAMHRKSLKVVELRCHIDELSQMMTNQALI